LRTLTATAEGETVSAKTSARVSGAAWACDAEITKVELSTDGGATWNDAKLLGESNSNAWRFWEFKRQIFEALRDSVAITPG
jgi:hypothetical protein